MPNKKEIETALIIYHEDPDHYLDEISALTAIDRFKLVRKDTLFIYDLYFDTADELLQDQGLALRLRKMANRQFLTLKGDSQLTEWGGHVRLEIEHAWSRDALEAILQELVNRNITLPPVDQPSDISNAVATLEKIGLKIIQQRQNLRTVRNIISGRRKTKPVLAELAIDSVAYHFRHHIVRINELEIEAKSEAGVHAIEEIVEKLRDKFKAVLKTWDHSKLVTGKAIEKLLAAGVLAEFLDDFNNLKPAGYDKIDDYIRTTRIEKSAEGKAI